MSKFNVGECTEFYCALREACGVTGTPACGSGHDAEVNVVADASGLTLGDLELVSAEDELLAQAAAGDTLGIEQLEDFHDSSLAD